MRFSTLLGASAVSVALPMIALANHDSNHARRHQGLAKRADNQVSKRGVSIDSARMSWYDITVGEVACEGRYGADDFVIALNAQQYGSYWKSDFCGQTVSITYNGKTANAKIVDECMGCGYGGIDLTKGLFSYFTSLDDGIVYGKWSIGGGGGGGDDAPATPKETPKTTSTKKYTPTSTTKEYVPPTTTQEKKTTTTKETPTSTPKPSTHTTTKATSTTPTSTSTSSKVAPTSSAAPSLAVTGVASGLAAVPSAIVQLTGTQNLNQMYYALVGLGAIVQTA